MDKAIICFSFDDGRGDNFSAYKEIMKPLSIPFTLNITTGFVDGTCSGDVLETNKPSLSIEQIIEMSKDPLVEFGNHGDKHNNEPSDIAKCHQKLMLWLKENNNAYMGGYASPNSKLKIETVNDNYILSSETIKYIRVGEIEPDNRNLAERILRKLFVKFKSNKLYALSRKSLIMHSSKGKIIYSLPVTRDRSVDEVKEIIKLCIKKRGAIVLMFHSIVDNDLNEDFWSYKKEKFEELCQWVSNMRDQGILEILTSMDMYRKLPHKI